MPKSKHTKKVTRHPKVLNRADIETKKGIGMTFDFNANLTPALQIVERLEALTLHLFVTGCAFMVGLYLIARGHSFTAATYRK